METDNLDINQLKDNDHQLFAEFIGKKVDKYLTAQKHFTITGGRVHWNWSAAFLGSIWLFYRKLYGLSLLYLLLLISFVVIIGSFPTVFLHSNNPKLISIIYQLSSLLALGMFAGLGCFGSYIYLNKAKKTILRYKYIAGTEDNLIEILRKKGNPSNLSLLVGIVITVIALLLAFLIGSTIISLNTDFTKSFENRMSLAPKSINEITIPYPLEQPEPEMSRVTIPDVGTIDIDNSLEVQNEAWGQAVESYKNDLGYVKPEGVQQNIVIQQKGLDKYCRIIVTTLYGEIGDFEPLISNYTATKDEIDYVSQTVKQATIQDLSYISGMKLLEWYPPRLETLNGMTAIVFSYRRQLDENPPVLVWEYRFQNNDRLEILTMSYRETEATEWKPIFEKSLKSFRITNIIS
ncbi:MAG: DUF2628 domain-containing protein [Clostridiaceae bacterium]|nr:DUF2628 domain-containing protein [Clostridiaceae bacterium]